MSLCALGREKEFLSEFSENEQGGYDIYKIEDLY